MRISASWLPRGPNAAVEESATVARIHITIGNRIATDMRAPPGGHTVVDHVVAPVYSLAEAIAYRWWTLAYQRGHTTYLRSMRAGFALPDISITAIGNGSIDVKCEPFVYHNPPVEFVTKASESVTVQAFQRDLTLFVEDVQKRLESEGVDGTPLSVRWTKIAESLDDPQEHAFCKAAGALGVDPYTCDEAAAGAIDAASAFFENDDLEEFLAGLRPQAITNAIGWLKEAERQPGEWSLLPAIEECRREIRFRKTADAAWSAGYTSARKVRKLLGFSESEPVGDLPTLARRLGNARFRATEPSATGLRGVSRIQPGRPQAIVGGSRNPANTLFAVARTFGDAIHFAAGRRSPVTEQSGTYRQALGRAFAAEFLAPVRPVLEMRSRGEPIEDIADTFGVADMVISHQIENRENNLAA